MPTTANASGERIWRPTVVWAGATDDVLVTAVGRSFRPGFLITGVLALLGGLALVVSSPSAARRSVLAAPALAAALLAPAGYALAHSSGGPEPVTITDPCADRASPDSGGVTGVLQDEALEQLDRVACENGSSREELVVAIADETAAGAYERKYGVNPRSLPGILEALPG